MTTEICYRIAREKHILHVAYPANEFSFTGPQTAPLRMTPMLKSQAWTGAVFTLKFLGYPPILCGYVSAAQWFTGEVALQSLLSIDLKRRVISALDLLDIAWLFLSKVFI